MALFFDEELNPFLSELTVDTQCSALPQLEETDDLADQERPLPLATASPSRDELFTFVQLAKVALHRLHIRPAGIARPSLARAEGIKIFPALAAQLHSRYQLPHLLRCSEPCWQLAPPSPSL